MFGACLAEADGRFSLVVVTADVDDDAFAERRMLDVVAEPRFQTRLLTTFSLLALLLAVIGTYGVLAYDVAERTREIGIRIALGADPRHLLRNVFARAGRQLGGGIIAGNTLILLLAWRADSLTADLLVSSVITSVIMAVVGVLACAAPARRALRVQPTEALRQV